MTSNDAPPQINTPEDNQELVAELVCFESFRELCASQAYKSCSEQITRLLEQPRLYPAPKTKPRLRSFLRVVQWNIERGSRLKGIVEILNGHPVLRFADLLLLNEVDIGMGRSGNLDVTRELGEALGAHAAFGAEYIELTKGTVDEQLFVAQNTAALHGNAVLARYPICDIEVVRLPRCENNFESVERRLGGRVALVAEIAVGDRRIISTATHLDVVGSPRCRTRQIREALNAAEARIGSGSLGAGTPLPAIFGGDLNTHTFSRRGRLDAMKNTALILGFGRRTLEKRLGRPERREGALRLVQGFGYEVESLNDGRPTSRSVVSALDDSKRLPWPMDWWVRRRVGPTGLSLEFRLDWLAQKGLRVLRAGEIRDPTTGVLSISPQTVLDLAANGSRLSDHDPIVVDLGLD